VGKEIKKNHKGGDELRRVSIRAERSRDEGTGELSEHQSKGPGASGCFPGARSRAARSSVQRGHRHRAAELSLTQKTWGVQGWQEDRFVSKPSG